MKGGSIKDRDGSWLFSPDGTRLAVLTPDLGERIGILEGKPRITIYELPELKQENDLQVAGLTSAAWTEGSGMIVTGNRKGQVQLWNVASKKASRTLGERNSEVLVIRAIPSGKRVAALWRDGQLAMWEGPDFGEILSQKVTEYPVLSLYVSPDGRFLVVTAHGAVGQTRLWNVATKAVVFERATWSRSVAFSRDSQRVAMGSDADGMILMVEVATARPVVSWRGDARRVRALAFDEAGTTLFSAGDDQSVRRWSIAPLDDIRRKSAQELFATAETETGLILNGLEHEPTPVGSKGLELDDAFPAMAVTSGTLADLIKCAHETINSVGHRIDDSRDEEKVSVFSSAEREVRDALRKCSDLAVKGAAAVYLLPLRASLQAILGDTLMKQSKRDEALEAYARAAELAGEAFQSHEDQTWPWLFRCYDRYADALREAGKPRRCCLRRANPDANPRAPQRVGFDAGAALE